MRYLKKIIPIALSLLVLSQFSNAQLYLLDPGKSTIKVEGTSTLHDWHLEVQIMDGSGNFIFEDGILRRVEDLKITIIVESLQSNKSAMDKNAHEALKSESFPFIEYLQTSVAKVSKDKIISVGQLTVAGFSREVTLTATRLENLPQSQILSGELTVKMTDFGIDPPTALLGTIKTGDAVNLLFNVRFKQ